MTRVIPVVVVLAFTLGCMSAGTMSDMAPPEVEAEEWADEDMDLGSGEYAMEGAKGGSVGLSAPSPMKSRAMDGRFAMDALSAEPEATELPVLDAPGQADDGGGEAVRQWFPESFLWQPLVETGPGGRADVDVRVPDQLTTWRVLALAHDARGSQAGAVHHFDSTLDVYVDPVVPGWLYSGDRVALPVAVVNTTPGAISGSLRVEASGPLRGSAAGGVALGPHGTLVQRVGLVASGSGRGSVEATLVGSDKAIRGIPVVPAGRPVRSVRGGLLSGERSFTLAGPAGADASTQRLTVSVFPGPLAVLQAEVERAGAGTVDAGYGFAVASAARTLAAAVGAEVDAEALRRLEVVSWQRVVRQGRSPDAGQAADLVASLKAVDGHALAEGLRARLVRAVVQGQRADGTWSRQERGTLQQVVVATAWAARALPEGEDGARLRASGALERYAREVSDPYTAAVVLSTGLLSEAQAERLRGLVAEAVTELPDGSRELVVPGGVVNPWGYRPTPAEARTFAWLALTEDVPWRGDLVAGLMSAYDASRGFGAGPADVLALEVVGRALPGLDGEAEVVLSVGGREVARSRLDAKQPKVPAVLVAPGAGEVSLSVSPAVPGLAWVATLDSWVPWTGDERLAGVEVEVAASPLWVGRDGRLTLTLAAPAGVGVVVEQGLPAGAAVDEAALAASAGSLLTGWAVHTDRVELTTRAFSAGEVMEIPLVVTPAFEGRFSTAPLTLRTTEAGAGEVSVAPLTWTVRG